MTQPHCRRAPEPWLTTTVRPQELEHEVDACLSVDATRL